MMLQNSNMMLQNFSLFEPSKTGAPPAPHCAHPSNTSDPYAQHSGVRGHAGYLTKTFVVKEADRSLGDGGGRGVIFFECANKLVLIEAAIDALALHSVVAGACPALSETTGSEF